MKHNHITTPNTTAIIAFSQSSTGSIFPSLGYNSLD